jgi:hypothetical protein
MTKFLSLILCFACALGIYAQDAMPEVKVDPLEALEVRGRLSLFIEEIETLLANVSSAKQKQLKKAEKSLSGIDKKWNVYSMAHQDIIAAEESLMEVVVNYADKKQQLSDSIQSQLHKLDCYDKFSDNEKYIEGQMEPYQKLYDEAVQFSLLKQTASQLEKLKAKEELTFGDVSAKYEESRTVSEEFPALKKRMENIEEQYIQIKGFSEKIKAAEYKPFLTRIKDYLYSLAAVAMLLMFANMVQAKIQAFKQMRKSAKEYQELLKKNEEDIPSI